MPRTKKIPKRDQVFDLLSANPLFYVDRWDNIVSNDGTWRYKFGKTALRFERKFKYESGGSTWNKKWSAYYKNIEIVDGKLKISKYN